MAVRVVYVVVGITSVVMTVNEITSVRVSIAVDVTVTLMGIVVVVYTGIV